MRSSFFPTTDSRMLAWSLQFLTELTGGPSTIFGISSGQLAAYSALHTTFSTTLAACDPAVRTKSAVSSKNLALANLKNNARLLASIINGQATVSDAQKLALGLTVKAPPAPHPVPPMEPGMSVLGVNAWTASIKLFDKSSSAQRGKPPMVSGASLFSYVGASAPSDMGAWKFEGNTGKTRFDVSFPNTLPAGTTVYLCAFWFNNAKQSGPACPAVRVTLQGGGVSSSSATTSMAA